MFALLNGVERTIITSENGVCSLGKCLWVHTKKYIKLENFHNFHFVEIRSGCHKSHNKPAKENVYLRNYTMFAHNIFFVSFHLFHYTLCSAVSFQNGTRSATLKCNSQTNRISKTNWSFLISLLLLWNGNFTRKLLLRSLLSVYSVIFRLCMPISSPYSKRTSTRAREN